MSGLSALLFPVVSNLQYEHVVLVSIGSSNPGYDSFKSSSTVNLEATMHWHSLKAKFIRWLLCVGTYPRLMPPVYLRYCFCFIYWLAKIISLLLSLYTLHSEIFRCEIFHGTSKAVIGSFVTDSLNTHVICTSCCRCQIREK